MPPAAAEWRRRVSAARARYRAGPIDFAELARTLGLPPRRIMEAYARDLAAAGARFAGYPAAAMAPLAAAAAGVAVVETRSGRRFPADFPPPAGAWLGVFVDVAAAGPPAGTSERGRAMTPQPGEIIPFPQRRRGPEPQPCPVVAVGHSDNNYYFVSPSGFLHRFRPSSLISRAGLLSLFDGNDEYLRNRWPRYKNGNLIDFNITAAGAAMIACACAAGLIDPPPRGRAAAGLGERGHGRRQRNE